MAEIGMTLIEKDYSDYSFKIQIYNFDTSFYGAKVYFTISEKNGDTITGAYDDLIYLGEITEDCLDVFTSDAIIGSDYGMQGDFKYTVHCKVIKADAPDEVWEFYQDITFEVFPDMETPAISETACYAKQVEEGALDIICGIYITGLRAGKGMISVRCVDAGGSSKYYCSFVAGEDYQGTTFSKTLEFSVDDFSVHTVIITARNFYDEYDEDTVSTLNIAVYVDEKAEVPSCVLVYECLDTPFAFENGKISGTVKNNIRIKASEWDSFYSNLNTIRLKAGLTKSVGVAVANGSIMTASLWNKVIRDIYELYDSQSVKRPENLTEVRPGGLFTSGLIDNMNLAIAEITNIIYKS